MLNKTLPPNPPMHETVLKFTTKDDIHITIFRVETEPYATHSYPHPDVFFEGHAIDKRFPFSQTAQFGAETLFGAIRAVTREILPDFRSVDRCDWCNLIADVSDYGIAGGHKYCRQCHDEITQD